MPLANGSLELYCVNCRLGVIFICAAGKAAGNQTRARRDFKRAKRQSGTTPCSFPPGIPARLQMRSSSIGSIPACLRVCALTPVWPAGKDRSAGGCCFGLAGGPQRLRQLGDLGFIGHGGQGNFPLVTSDPSSDPTQPSNSDAQSAEPSAQSAGGFKGTWQHSE